MIDRQHRWPSQRPSQQHDHKCINTHDIGSFNDLHIIMKIYRHVWHNKNSYLVQSAVWIVEKMGITNSCSSSCPIASRGLFYEMTSMSRSSNMMIIEDQQLLFVCECCPEQSLADPKPNQNEKIQSGKGSISSRTQTKSPWASFCRQRMRKLHCTKQIRILFFTSIGDSWKVVISIISK